MDNSVQLIHALACLLFGNVQGLTERTDRKLGVDRIAPLAPYSQTIRDQMADYLSKCSLAVNRVGIFGNREPDETSPKSGATARSMAYSSPARVCALPSKKIGRLFRH